MQKIMMPKRMFLLSAVFISLMLIIGVISSGEAQNTARVNLCSYWKSTAPDTENDDTLHIHFISGSEEYHSEHSLKDLKQTLEQDFSQVKVTASWGQDEGKDLPNIDLLAEADLMLVFSRRMTLSEDQLSYILQYVKAEKPVIGIRTASHAFQNFLEFDAQVLGGDYDGHSDAEPIKVVFADSVEEHPILQGVRPWTRLGKMYHNPDLGPHTQVLLLGKGLESSISEPLAWTNFFGDNGRAFYTSMGQPADFGSENFRQMLFNAITWTTGYELQKKSD